MESCCEAVMDSDNLGNDAPLKGTAKSAFPEIWSDDNAMIVDSSPKMGLTGSLNFLTETNKPI